MYSMLAQPPWAPFHPPPSRPDPFHPSAFNPHCIHLPFFAQCPSMPARSPEPHQIMPNSLSDAISEPVIKIIPLSVIHAPNSVIQIPYNTHAPLTSRCLIRTGDESIQPLDDQCQIRHVGFMPLCPMPKLGNPNPNVSCRRHHHQIRHAVPIRSQTAAKIPNDIETTIMPIAQHSPSPTTESNACQISTATSKNTEGYDYMSW